MKRVAVAISFLWFFVQGFAQPAEIKRLQDSVNARYRVVPQPGKFEWGMVEPFTSEWSLFHATYYFTCRGDLCAEPRVGLIGTRGDTLLPIFTGIHRVNDQLLLCAEKWSALVTATLTVKEAFDDTHVDRELFLIRKKEGWGAYTNELVELIPPTYEGIRPYRQEWIKNDEWVTERCFVVKKNGKWGAVNDRNQAFIQPLYDDLIPLPANFSLAGRKQKFGLIGRNGQALTAFKYDSLYQDFSRQVIARVGNHLGLLSDEGKEISPIAYTEISRQSTYGCRCVSKNGKLAMLSGAGKELTPFVYDRIQRYDPPTDVWVLQKNGKWGFFDCETQKELTPFVYEKVSGFSVYEAEVLLNGVKKKIKLK